MYFWPRMNANKRESSICGLLIVLAVRLVAQPNAPGTPFGPSPIERSLKSGSPQEVAWAAWNAGAEPTLAVVQGLREALKHAVAATDADSRHLTPILLDALIRSGARLSAAEILPLYDSFPNEAVAIAVSDSNRDDEFFFPLLLSAEAQRNRAHWLAIALGYRTANFKEHLAKQVRFEYSIDVVDSEYAPVMVYEGVPGGVIGGVPGGVMPPFGWPPTSRYCVTLSPQQGDQVLVRTLRGDVYLHRSSAEDPPCDRGDWRDHPLDVLRFLYSFAHCAVCSFDTPQFPDILGGKGTVFWRSPEQIQALLREVVQRYVLECRRFLDRVGQNQLSDDEVRSRISIHLNDRRRAKTHPIPDLAELLRTVSAR